MKNKSESKAIRKGRSKAVHFSKFVETKYNLAEAQELETDCTILHFECSNTLKSKSREVMRSMKMKADL